MSNLTSGAHCILQCDNDCEFLNNAIKELDKFWPVCGIVARRLQHLQNRSSIDPSNQHMENIIKP